MKTAKRLEDEVKGDVYKGHEDNREIFIKDLIRDFMVLQVKYNEAEEWLKEMQGLSMKQYISEYCDCSFCTKAA